MNYLRIVFVVALCLFVSRAEAQPQQVDNDAGQRDFQPQEDAVRWLVYAYNRHGEMQGRARGGVVGANPNDPALEEVDEEYEKARGTFLLSVDNFKTQVNGDKATVAFKATLTDNLLNQITQTEKLELQPSKTQWTNTWIVVPGKPETVANDKNSGILLRLATFMAHPQEMLDTTRMIVSRQNMQQLALGVMHMSHDYNEKFAVKSDKFKETLAPYVKSEQLFYAPADKSGMVSYSFNPKLTGMSTHLNGKARETVLVYEGRDEKLDFRYGGQAIVILANGTIKMVTPEEAKSLRWEPNGEPT